MSVLAQYITNIYMISPTRPIVTRYFPGYDFLCSLNKSPLPPHIYISLSTLDSTFPAVYTPTLLLIHKPILFHSIMSRTKRRWGQGPRGNNSADGSRKRSRFGKRGQPSQQPNNNDTEQRQVDNRPQSDHPNDADSRGAGAHDPNTSAPDPETEEQRQEKSRLAEHSKKIRSTKLNIKEREKALRKHLKKKRNQLIPQPIGSWLGPWNLYTASPNNKSGKYNTHHLTLSPCPHDPRSESIDNEQYKLCLQCQHGHESNHARGIVSLDNGNQRFELLCFQVPAYASFDALSVPLRMCGDDGGEDESMTMSIVFVGKRRMRASITKSCLPNVEDVGEMRFTGGWVG